MTATRADTAELIKGLRDLLGARLVAYLGGVRETRAVREWADGERSVRDADDQQRLRIAYQAALLIVARDKHEVAQSWFQGLNPQLDDRSPARVLREEKPEEAGRSCSRQRAHSPLLADLSARDGMIITVIER